MKKITLIVVALLTCFANGFAEANPYAEPDIGVCSYLSGFETQAEYCKKEYANRPKRETNVGAMAILHGMEIVDGYQVAMRNFQSDKPLLNQHKYIEAVVLNHLSIYSGVWSKAIENHSQYPDYDVDFNTALSITNSEFSRLGVPTTLTELKKSLMGSMSEYDSAKYPNTFQVYAVLSQMIGLALEPRGSLQSYNQTVNSLQSDFERFYALAELENPKPKQKAIEKPKVKAKMVKTKAE